MVFRRFAVRGFLVGMGDVSDFCGASAAPSLRSTLLGKAGWHRVYFAEARTLDVRPDANGAELDAQGPTMTVVNRSANQMAQPERRHSPGTLGTCFPGAPDTIRTCDLCLRGLAPYPASPLLPVAEPEPIG
jgi:hypothetical protein